MADLRSLPAEITVLSGRFGPFPAAQPFVFAHLGDVAPGLDLDHVEVIPRKGGATRLAQHFDESAISRLSGLAGDDDTFVLILPSAFEGLDPPPLASDRLRSLGNLRGTVRRLLGTGTGAMP
jgi:hypothetical protein